MADLDWALDDFGKPEYLDGLMARYMVYAGGSSRVPVAYCFQQDAGQLVSAAPALLTLLSEVRKIIPYTRSNGIIAECTLCVGKAVSAEGGHNVPHTDACLIARIDAALTKAGTP